MLKLNLTKWEFEDLFSKANRESNFSYEGKGALYDYFDELSEDLLEDITIDIIAICVEYTEYENLKELQDNYNDIESFEDLEDHTQVIRMYDHNNNLLEKFIILDF